MSAYKIDRGNPSRKYRKLSWRLSRLLGVAAVCVLLVGIATAVNDWHVNNQANHRAAKAVAAANKGVSNGVPSTNSVPADTFANYKVPPNNPRYIYIPAIGVKAIVLSLGTTSANQIEAPPNVYETGWYDNSALPGQAGAMLIDGHVSSWTAHGVFYSIKKLKAGDAIQIQTGSGTMFNYKVIKSQIYDSNNVDMATALEPVNSAQKGLNLITCTGGVIPGTNEFNQRIVVFSRQV